MSDRKMIRVKDVMKISVDIVDDMATVRESLQEMKHVDI